MAGVSIEPLVLIFVNTFSSKTVPTAWMFADDTKIFTTSEQGDVLQIISNMTMLRVIETYSVEQPKRLVYNICTVRP